MSWWKWLWVCHSQIFMNLSCSSEYPFLTSSFGYPKYGSEYFFVYWACL